MSKSMQKRLASQKRYKNVLMPIRVPNNDYCWNSDTICGNFSSENGHPSCDLGLGDLKFDKELRVLKPYKCSKLKEV